MIVEYHREVKQNSEEDVKMIRRIIQIDREKCNGCGACAETCHEGAIAMVDGKARLMAGRLPARLSHGRDHLCGARSGGL